MAVSDRHIEHKPDSAIDALIAGRGGKLPPQAQQVKGAEDFELVTWLIIQDDKTK